MIVSLDVMGTYIRCEVRTTKGAMVLRRWPWPNEEWQRRKHMREANAYCELLARTLQCPFEALRESEHGD